MTLDPARRRSARPAGADACAISRFAALAVIALEPEALLGASFQLSFAAVAGAGRGVWRRARRARRARKRRGAARRTRSPRRDGCWPHRRGLRRRAARRCCSRPSARPSPTASFMAYDFHELSPYVLIGNPLTLTMIEFFAVPGALLGAAALSARARRLGLALSRARHQLHHCGVARWIARRAGRRRCPASLRALGDRLSDARRALGGAVAHAGCCGSPRCPCSLLGLDRARPSGERFDLAIAPTGDIGRGARRRRTA